MTNRLIIITVTIAAGLLMLLAGSNEPPRGEAGSQFFVYIDADADAPGLQSTRTVHSSDPFTIAIIVAGTASPYTGYEWGLTSGPAVQEASAPTHNSTAGTGTGMTDCYGSPGVGYGCSGPPTEHTGWVSEIDLRCVHAGTQALYSYASFVPNAPVQAFDATITCSSALGQHPDAMSIRHSSGDRGPYGGGTVLNVPVGSMFNAEVWVDGATTPSFTGYQWELLYDPAYLAPTGNVSELTGTYSLCNGPSSAAFGAYIIYGFGSGCVSPSPFPPPFTGHTTNIQFQCLDPTTPSPTPLALVSATNGEDVNWDPSFGSALMDGGLFRQTSTRHKGPHPLGGTMGQITVNCYDPPADSDADGCSNAEEAGLNQLAGGKRNMHDANDFFDVPAPALKASMPNGVRNKAVSLIDVGAVLYFVGTVDDGMPNMHGYDYDTDFNANLIEDGAEYDRTPSMIMGQPWRSGPPNGAVSLTDVGIALAQVGTNCVPPP